jgi:hypothetical protein
MSQTCKLEHLQDTDIYVDDISFQKIFKYTTVSYSLNYRENFITGMASKKNKQTNFQKLHN